MASIYAVQKVSHIYFAYKYIIYTHVITCRNIQASREGLPLKRDRALFSDLQPKKKKKKMTSQMPCMRKRRGHVSKQPLAPAAFFVTCFRERRHWLPRVRRSQTIVWRHWAGGAILVFGMWCVLTTLLLTSADWEDGGGHPSSSRWGRKKRVTICSRYEVELSSTNMIIGFRTNKTWAIKYTT